MTEKLVTVAVFMSPYEAGMAKAELEAYDIPAFVADEFAVLLQGAAEGRLEAIMNRARQMLADGTYVSEHGLPVRFSMGSSTTYLASVLEGTIRDADMAMYKDKVSRKTSNTKARTRGSDLHSS